MSSKNVKKKSRRWTQEETEKLALKKSSNNEVLMHIQQKFMNVLKLDSFKEINEKKFQDKNGIVSKYTELETGIDKLRVKYKALKQEWSSITDCIKMEVDFPLTRSLAGLNI